MSENVARILKGSLKPTTIRAGTPLAAEIFLGRRVAKPNFERLHPSLKTFADRLAAHVQNHTRAFKLASKKHADEIVGRGAIHARLADNAAYLYAWTCVLSRLDQLSPDASIR